LRQLLGKLNGRKQRHFRRIPNGIPGIATRLSILFSEGVMKGRIDINQFVAVTSTNHAKLYGLYPHKGTMAIGADADIALWDPDKRITLTNDILLHGADYTPYEGQEVRGWPVHLLLGGETIVKDGLLTQRERRGSYLKRNRSSLLSRG
jgi:dihydropyrimidinase